MKQIKNEDKEIDAGNVLRCLTSKHNIKDNDSWPEELPDAKYLLNILL